MATHQRPWSTHLALALLGAAAALGWSPANQVWITWIAFAVLVACLVRAASPLQALTQCLCFALGLHLLGHGWVFTALYHHTQAGPVWSAVGSALFVTYLALFMAIPASICKRLSKSKWANGAASTERGGGAAFLAIMLAIGWTAAEAARGHFFNGFDSLAAGYLFSGSLLRGWVPVLGVCGCGLLFYASAGLAGAVWARRPGLTSTLATTASLCLLIGLAGGAWLDTLHWVAPDGVPLSYRLIQDGIPQREKFDPQRRDAQISAHARTITAARADLIVTSETAFPLDLTEVDPASLSRMRAFSSLTRSNVFLGMFHVDDQGGVRNSLVQLAPGSFSMSRYDKVLLMPFGEYAPAGLDWFARRLSIAHSDLTPGRPDQAPFTLQAGAGAVKVSALLCNETLSNSAARHWVRRTGLLLNPGNLAWFAGSAALPQQLQVAQVRALETGRPILRATNTGVTAHIDEKGRVVRQLPEGKKAVLEGLVQPTRGLTPFARFGHLPAIGLAALLSGAAVLASWLCRRGVARAHAKCD